MQALDMKTMQENAAQAEQMLSLLANRHRLMILCSLIEEEKSVGQLVDASPLSQSAVSQHLAKMREAEIVKTRREGQIIYYSIASQNVRVLIETLCGLYGGDDQNILGASQPALSAISSPE